MMKADNFHVQLQEISGLKVNVTSYKLGDRFFCHIANVDPGATIARTDGDTEEEAVQAAFAKAMLRLSSRTSH
jgi:hypothetical protein